MSTDVTQPLALLSDALAAQVAAAAPWVTAIRIGGNRHIAGIVWRPDVVLTSDQALPAQDSYSLTGSDGTLLAARAARRDPATNLVCLNLENPAATAPMRAAALPSVGSLALALGAAADGSPTVRLAVVHRVNRANAGSGGAMGDTIILDLAAEKLPEGGPVLDARGGLLGMASPGPLGEAMVVPHATINRFLDPLGLAKTLPAAQARRGWLGVALQPINVPPAMRAIAHQTSGRLVVSVTPGGPAEHAGMRLGDVLLAIDGESVSGPHGLRDFIRADRIGSAIEVRVLRDGTIRNMSLRIAPQPVS
jgi:S1-C subfamily serine protease